MDIIPAEAALAADLALMSQETGVEFTIVVMGRMADYGHFGKIEPFATQLFNQRGVGDASRNGGAMMLTALKDRQMRIELGRGYRSRLNVAMEEVIESFIIPALRNERYVSGIQKGANAVSLVLTDGRLGEHGMSDSERTNAAWLRAVTPKPWWAPILLVIGGFAFVWRRRKKCPNCGALKLSHRRETVMDGLCA